MAPRERLEDGFAWEGIDGWGVAKNGGRSWRCVPAVTGQSVVVLVSYFIIGQPEVVFVVVVVVLFCFGCFCTSWASFLQCSGGSPIVQ